MRTRITLIICLCLFAVGRASAQWAVIDPSNIAQSIVNTSKNVVHTSTTAQNMIKNFQETVKIYEQGKKYYDALKSVNNLVKDARKVQQTILMVGDITDTYVTSFQRMMRDDNFTVEELGAIAFGYTKLLEESNDVLTELRNVVNIIESAGVRGISRILFPFPLTVIILRLKSMLHIFNEINSARRMPVSYSVLIIMRLSLLEYKSEASL